MKHKILRHAALLAGLICAGNIMADDDPYLWLEDVNGATALEWVEEHNARSLAHLKAHPLFQPIHDRVLEIISSEERIAYPDLLGDQVYNFWRDADHVRGIWKVTSLEEYRRERPHWKVILDIDKLAEEEGENWVWAGSTARYPDYDRAMVGLSRGGADAAVRREFDLRTCEFVEHGFFLPEAKSQVVWRDRDSLFVGTDFGPGTLTDSGYPNQVRLWKRGAPVEEAELIFEGETTDVASSGIRLWDHDVPYDFVVRNIGFFTRHYFLYREGELQKLSVPDDARIAGVIDGQLLIDLKSDWKPGTTRFAQGTLLAAPLEKLLLGEHPYEILYEPGARTAVSSVWTTSNQVLVSVLDNVIGQLLSFRFDGEGWKREVLTVPDMGSVTLVSTDAKSDRFFYGYTGFLTPSSLYESDAATDHHQRVRSEPPWFESTGMNVTQHEATSSDGTAIPYFLVTPRNFDPEKTYPTLLYAYGGFEISRTPAYSGALGASWLEKGGVYVVANIRGGGEFGPGWHQAALRSNRQRAFDDLIAVTEDLIQRGITTTAQLGIQGGSNGGLLVASAFTQRPDLFNAVVCQVPLLDMRRYHRLLAGASWMAEFGNPDDPEDWAFLSKYSPYHNVRAEADYPKVLFTTSTRDDRVHPAHARKMVARMTELGHQVLYYENIEGGHGGSANLKQQAFVAGLIYTYLHDRLNRNSSER